MSFPGVAEVLFNLYPFIISSK